MEHYFHLFFLLWRYFTLCSVVIVRVAIVDTGFSYMNHECVWFWLCVEVFFVVGVAIVVGFKSFEIKCNRICDVCHKYTNTNGLFEYLFSHFDFGKQFDLYHRKSTYKIHHFWFLILYIFVNKKEIKMKSLSALSTQHGYIQADEYSISMCTQDTQTHTKYTITHGYHVDRSTIINCTLEWMQVCMAI